MQSHILSSFSLVTFVFASEFKTSLTLLTVSFFAMFLAFFISQDPILVCVLCFHSTRLPLFPMVVAQGFV